MIARPAVRDLATPASSPPPDTTELPTAAGAVETAGRSGAEASCPTADGAADCVLWSAAHLTDLVEVAVAGGHVVTAEGTGRVTARTLGDGRVRWSASVSPPVRLHPEVAGTIPVQDREGVRFLAAGTGSRVGAFDGPVGASASTGPLLLTIEGDHLRARAVGGAPSWERHIPDDALAWVTGNAAYLSRWVTLRSDRLTRLGGTTGRDRWEVTIDGRVASVGALGDATVVAVDDTGNGASVVLVEPDGALRAEHQVAGRVAWVTPDPVGRRVVAVTEGSEIQVTIVDTASGHLRARTSLGARTSGTLPPAVGEHVVAIARAGPDPTLTVLGSADGLVRFELPLPRPARSVAVVGDQTVVVHDDEGLTAWSLATGARRWQLDLGPTARTVHGVPLVVRDGRRVLALDPDPTLAERRQASPGHDRLGTRRSAGRYDHPRGNTS